MFFILKILNISVHSSQTDCAFAAGDLTAKCVSILSRSADFLQRAENFCEKNVNSLKQNP
jgi:hypothetical protein